MIATPIFGKTIFLNLLFQNQKACDIGTWYVALGCVAYLFCSNEDSKLTLTYLKSGPMFLHNAFKWDFFDKLIF